MHRVLFGVLLIGGLVVSGGCFNRSTEPVHREGTSAGRMKKDSLAAPEVGAKGKKSSGLKPPGI